MDAATKARLDGIVKGAASQVDDFKVTKIVTDEMRQEAIQALLMADVPATTITNSVFGCRVLPDQAILITIAPFMGDLNQSIADDEGVLPFPKTMWKVPLQMFEVFLTAGAQLVAEAHALATPPDATPFEPGPDEQVLSPEEIALEDEPEGDPAIPPCGETLVQTIDEAECSASSKDCILDRGHDGPHDFR